MKNVQDVLGKLADLARAEQVAILSDDDALVSSIDKSIEETIGEKERAIGALREHVAEHAC